MYKITLELEVKNDMHLKDSYEKIAVLIRKYIDGYTKKLKDEHYHPSFSYYSFSNMSPSEKDMVYRRGHRYIVELRSLESEFLNMKKVSNLETEDLVLLTASSGKLYYFGQGNLFTETPVFLNTKKIDNDIYESEVKEKVRENILFRYLKSGINKNDDIDYLRENIVDSITVHRKVITIPSERKKLHNGNKLLYHCIKLEITFQDNPVAKEVEQVIYTGGLGMKTSNGFGFMNS